MTHFWLILALFLPHEDPKSQFSRNQIHTQYQDVMYIKLLSKFQQKLPLSF